MNSNTNTTPTSRRNRRSRSGTPQQDPNVGFQPFAQPGYIPQFQDPNVGFQPTYFPPNFQVPPQFTYQGLVQQGFTPANFTLPQPSAFNTGNDSDSEEDVEFVADTQPQTPQTPHSIPTQESIPTQQPTRFQNRAPKQRWTRDEEVALVSSYVDVSEDPVVGNSQRHDSFWRRVEERFYTICNREKYRSKDQLNTKWKELNRKCTSFAGIYNNLMNGRSSGMSDADVLKTAHTRYESQFGVDFVHQRCFDVLKEYPKWNVVPTMSTSTSRPSKRSKTSGSSDANFNVNIDADDFDEDDIPQRPIGRTKAKKASTSNPSTEELLGQMKAYNARTDSKVEYQLKKLELEKEKLEVEKRKLEVEQERIELQKRQQFERDYQFLMSRHDHLTGDELALTLARKRQLRQLYNL